LALVLLALILLAFLFWDVARDHIVTPLARILHIGNLWLRVVPQVLFWILLLGIGLPIAFRSLGLDARRGSQDANRERTAAAGRVKTLLRWVQRVPKSYYFRHRMAYHLAKLALESRGYRLSGAACVMSERGDSQLDDLDMPPEIRAYFQAGMVPQLPVEHFSLFGFWRLWQSPEPYSPIDLDPEVVVKFLEDQLED
jgi:hypothetical protein